MINVHGYIEVEMEQDFDDEDVEFLKEEYDVEEDELETFFEGEVLEQFTDFVEDEELERLKANVTITRTEGDENAETIEE